MDKFHSQPVADVHSSKTEYESAFDWVWKIRTQVPLSEALVNKASNVSPIFEKSNNAPLIWPLAVPL
jgi:hypothetical protein